VKLTKFALNRPVTVLMAFLSVILIGLISWQRLSVELLPSMNTPQITILTTYENVAPPEIETLITRPIEEAVGTVKGVKQIESVSKEGVSLVTLDFEWDVDTNVSALDVREKIDVVKGSLPRDVGNPIIVKFDPSSIPIMTLGVSGSSNLIETTRIASDEIKQKLERIPGVALARISGAVEREILVAVDQGRLFAHNIPISKVVEKLKEANFNFPGGKIEKAKNEIRIRTIGQFETLEDLENVVLIRTPQKIPIFIRDVARIIDTFKEKQTDFTINDKPSIGISIFKQADSNTVEVADRLTREIDGLQAALKPDVQIVTVFNQATFIKNAISDLQWAGILGGILAFLVLLLFLRSFQSALIITTAIPISVLGAFILMYSAGISLNIMSLGGLALGVGLLVDNGIVILENIHRHRRDMPDIERAVITGADEMQNPIIASTLAHIIVFLPIMFVKGLAGKFFVQLALTISFSLLMSILVAMFLNPMLEAKRVLFDPTGTEYARPSQPSWVLTGFLRRTLHRFLNPLWNALERGMQILEERYVKTLDLAMNRRKPVLAVTLLVFMLSLALVGGMGKEFIPAVDQGSFNVKITTPPGTSLGSTVALVRKVGKIFSGISEVQDVFVNIGYDRHEKTEMALADAEQNIGRMTVILKPDRSRSLEEIVNGARPEIALIPGAKIEYILNQDVSQFLALKQESPEILKITGTTLKTIQQITAEALDKLRELDCIEDLKSSLLEDEPEIQIHPDRLKAASLKLTIKDIADAVKTAVEGEVVTRFHDDDQEIDIRVRLRDEDTRSLDKLGQVFIQNSEQQAVPLREVAGIAYSQQLRQIQRRDLSRVAVISANFTGVTLSEGLQRVKDQISGIELPPDHSIELSDEHGEMNRSFQHLMLALVLSILLVYMLLASLFESLLQPFIIMFAVPLGAIGVILILFLTATPISLGVYIGSIMLGGIVVNNSIILIDYTGRLRNEGFAGREAAVEGGRVRLRPILMTALTTILGLIPLAVGGGEGSEIRNPLALTVIGGLAASTLMTLILVPVIYTIFEEMRGRNVKDLK